MEKPPIEALEVLRTTAGALIALRGAVMENPAMQGRAYAGLGITVNRAVDESIAFLFAHDEGAKARGDIMPAMWWPRSQHPFAPVADGSFVCRECGRSQAGHEPPKAPGR